MGITRRALLKTCGASSVLALATSVGLLRPAAARAEWNKAAFEASTLADAFKRFGVSMPEESKDILIKAPDIAENGAVVPIEITSRIPETKSITIFAEKNPQPLVASFDFAPGVESYVSTRIKLGETGLVRVVANAGGKYFSASKEIKVTIGGCG
jgi:sulfur-oxidizing protein SoxY